MLTAWWARWTVAALLMASAGGCIGLGPYLDPITATAVARDPMRQMQTKRVHLYYPQGHAAAGLEVLSRLQQCIGELEQYLVVQGELDPAVIILHRGEQNNAYVSPAGDFQPEFMVLPMHEGLEMFNLLNLGLVDIGHVSCHEALHYLTYQQTWGFWRAINRFFGEFLAPNVFLEPWFHEGMATYYEARLAGPVGRPDSDLWNGMFEAGAAARGGDLQAGYLSMADRELGAFGGHYLVGMHFVQYLAEHYGEEKLWQVIDTQGRSIFSVFGVTLRFRSVYGKTLGALYDEWVDVLKQTQWRTRPAEQKPVIPPVGYWARMATCPARGWIAVANEGTDEVPRLSLYDAHGSIQWTHRLTDIFPGREHLTPSSQLISGMSFTGDCRSLYFTAADIDPDTAYESALWQVDTADGSTLNTWPEIYGVGGSIDPQGENYAYIRLVSETATLTVRDLRRNEDNDVPHVANTTSIGAPAFSPDGRTLAFSARTPRGFNLFVQLPNGTIEQLTDDAAFNYAPHWLDANTLLFSHDLEGHPQAFALDVATHAQDMLTDAPHALMDAAPLDADHLAFLNAEGWAWSVDTVPRRPLKFAAVAPAPQNPAAAAAEAQEVHAVSQLFASDANAPAAPAAGSTAPANAGAGAPRPHALLSDMGSSGDTDPRAAQTPLIQPAPIPEVLSDEPYSAWDGLWIPSGHAPWLFAVESSLNPGKFAWQAGFEVMGQDRLGFHRYLLQATYSPIYYLPNVSIGYLNAQLSPWQIFAQAGLDVNETDMTYYGAVGIARPFWTNSLSFSLQFLDTGPNVLAPSSQTPNYLLWGPGVTFQYAAQENTPYGGPRRALVLAAQAQAYPEQFGNTASLVDVKVSVSAAVPLPFSERHQLVLNGRARALMGDAPRSLRIGGVSPGNILFYGTNGAAQGTPAGTLTYYQSTLSLVEPQQGYEDTFWGTDRAAIGQVNYTYPFIIDYGWQSFLYLFPSVFIEEVDLGLFASASWVNAAPVNTVWHRSVGGTATLATFWGGRLGLSLVYQLAYRWDDVQHGWAHLVYISG